MGSGQNSIRQKFFVENDPDLQNLKAPPNRGPKPFDKMRVKTVGMRFYSKFSTKNRAKTRQKQFQGFLINNNSLLKKNRQNFLSKMSSGDLSTKSFCRKYGRRSRPTFVEGPGFRQKSFLSNFWVDSTKKFLSKDFHFCRICSNSTKYFVESWGPIFIFVESWGPIFVESWGPGF